MPEFEVEVTVEVTKRYRVNATDKWEALGFSEVEAEEEFKYPGVRRSNATKSRIVSNGAK